MQEIEPFFGWREYYRAEDDDLSPYFGKSYSEFEYTDAIYNHYIHPQWDNIDSESLFAKILYVNYESEFAIIELFGEWNDAISNDIGLLTTNLLSFLIDEGVNKIILLGTNVLNFHSGETDYYSELADSLDSGWITLVDFRDHVLSELENKGILNWISLSEIDFLDYRDENPETLFFEINNSKNIKQITNT